MPSSIFPIRLARLARPVRLTAAAIAFVAPFSASPAQAGDQRPPTETCFNAVCSYQREGEDGRYEKCQAAAVFRKWVTAEGDEIADKSAFPQNPMLEVECDQRVLHNNGARRFTDALGTRIQAQAGPYPAILLPRKALREGHRYEPSALELDGQHLRGYCYIYTGPQ